jgi:hypothetical protein
MVSATEVTDVRATIEAAVPRMVPHGTAVAVDVLEGIEVSAEPRSVNGSASNTELRYVESLGARLPAAFRGFELALTSRLPLVTPRISTPAPPSWYWARTKPPSRR